LISWWKRKCMCNFILISDLAIEFFCSYFHQLCCQLWICNSIICCKM
jgi:hypothetical protein